MRGDLVSREVPGSRYWLVEYSPICSLLSDAVLMLMLIVSLAHAGQENMEVDRLGGCLFDLSSRVRLEIDWVQSFPSS